MITIDLGELEYFNSTTEEFDYESGGVVRFEYSLKALYNWEAKWKKPFLKGGHTKQELVDFYMMMALDPMDEKFMTSRIMLTISDYITEEQTATVFSTSEEASKKISKAKTHTAEEIYALMISANVPLDFENRNLNRLLIILRIISNFNEPPKKMNKQDIYKQNAALNAERKAKMKTKG